jgi:hypothetical protein
MGGGGAEEEVLTLDMLVGFADELLRASSPKRPRP